MGIFGLENVCVRDFDVSQFINISDEIKNWQCKNGRDPIIIIDLKELLKMLVDSTTDQSFVYAVKVGGRYQKFNEILEYFFGEMKRANAKLVFFARRRKLVHKYFRHLDERILYNLVHSICSKYGTLYMSYGLEERSILAYAREYQNDVMALITRNMAFLVFENQYSYWSLSHVNFYEMKILKISRQNAYNLLKVNQTQMQLMLALCDALGKIKLKRLLLTTNYSKRQQFHYDPNELEGNYTEKQRELIGQKLNIIVEIDNYNGSFTEDIYDGLILDLKNTDENFAEMLIFFRDNNYFAYTILQDEEIYIHGGIRYLRDFKPMNIILFMDFITTVTIKLFGTIFKDIESKKKPRSRLIRRKLNLNIIDEMVAEIIYPSMPLPTLNQMILDENNEQYDEARYTLLKWLLDIDYKSIEKFKTSTQSKFIRIVRLTLDVLIMHNLITNNTAKIIFLTEFEGNDKSNVYVPKSFRQPIPKPDWSFEWYEPSIQISQIYTITFHMICQCLELCGLRKYTDLIKFDAYAFHTNMNLAFNNDKRIKQSLYRLQNMYL